VKELSSNKGICLTDGKTYLLIRPCDNNYYRSMSQGLDHIGFKVESIEAVKKELDELAQLSLQSAQCLILAIMVFLSLLFIIKIYIAGLIEKGCEKIKKLAPSCHSPILARPYQKLKFLSRENQNILTVRRIHTTGKAG